MKLLLSVYLFIYIGSINQIESNETINIKEFKIENVSLDKFTKKVLYSKFGKPIKINHQINEFTGEESDIFNYLGISFEIDPKGNVILDEINSSEINVTYKTVNIRIGTSFDIFKPLFPKCIQEMTNNQLTIRANNSSASYFVIYFKNDKVFSISINENY
jgi:hypothetical protein